MKTFALTLATALMALSANAKLIEEKFAANKLSQNNTWPTIKYYNSYKMSFEVYTWNGW